MNKYEYRCNRCLVIVERWLFGSEKARNSVPCHKCGGLAVKVLWEKWGKDVFEDHKKEQNNFS